MDVKCRRSHIFYYKLQNLVHCCLKRISNNVWLEEASKFAENMSNGGTVCILLAHRRNRNNDDPPLVRKFSFKRTNKRPWETIPLAVLTVLEDWLATFKARDISACLGQCCPGTSWMPRSLQQWSMMIKPQRRTHERLQCGIASVSSWNYHINITNKSGTCINIIISIVQCDDQTFQSFPTTFISNLTPTRYNSQTKWKQHVHKLFKNISNFWNLIFLYAKK